MLNTIRDFFETRILADTDATEEASIEHGHRLATAALLVEMTRADFNATEKERQAVLRTMQRVYELEDHETRELVALAEQEANEATSLYPFTSLINRHFSAPQKVHVIELLWEIAYVSGKLDKYEEHLVRKVADLLHVPHSAFIRAKHKVSQG